MESIVTLSGNLPVVSSTAIAEGVGREHKSVIQLVRQNLSDFEEFGPLTFEMRVGKPLPQGGFAYRTEIALLNEQQATLLLTYMRNNEVVRAFKKRLVRAFYEMAQRVRKGGDDLAPKTASHPYYHTPSGTPMFNVNAGISAYTAFEQIDLLLGSVASALLMLQLVEEPSTESLFGLATNVSTARALTNAIADGLYEASVDI